MKSTHQIAGARVGLSCVPLYLRCSCHSTRLPVRGGTSLKSSRCRAARKAIPPDWREMVGIFSNFHRLGKVSKAYPRSALCHAVTRRSTSCRTPNIDEAGNGDNRPTPDIRRNRFENRWLIIPIHTRVFDSISPVHVMPQCLAADSVIQSKRSSNS